MSDQDGRAVITLSILAISVPTVWGLSLLLGRMVGAL